MSDAAETEVALAIIGGATEQVTSEPPGDPAVLLKKFEAAIIIPSIQDRFDLPQTQKIAASLITLVFKSARYLASKAPSASENQDNLILAFAQLLDGSIIRNPQGSLAEKTACLKGLRQQCDTLLRRDEGELSEEMITLTLGLGAWQRAHEEALRTGSLEPIRKVQTEQMRGALDRMARIHAKQN